MRCCVDIRDAGTCIVHKISWAETPRHDRNRCFKPNHHVFQTLTRGFSCLNPTRAWAQHCHKIKQKIWSKDTLSCNINTCKVSVYVWFAETLRGKHLFCFGDRVAVDHTDDQYNTWPRTSYNNDGQKYIKYDTTAGNDRAKQQHENKTHGSLSQSLF